MTVYVQKGAFWSTQFPSLEAYLGQQPSPQEKAAASCLDTRTRGRASQLTRMVAELWSQLAIGADELEEKRLKRSHIVCGSTMGEINTTVQLLGMMNEGDGQVMPARFKSSVHNTGSGVLSITHANESAATAIVAGSLSFAMALLEAWVLVSTTGEDALLLFADEHLPHPFEDISLQVSMGVGLWLTSRHSEKSWAKLGMPVRNKRGTPALIGFNATMRHHPAMPGLFLLNELQRGVFPETIWLGSAGERHWELTAEKVQGEHDGD